MDGDLELLRVNPLGIRKWRPQYAVLKGATLHLSQGKGTPDLKTLPLAGAAVAFKDITRPADAWRNLFMLILPPLADRSRGIKEYTFSAVTAELQAAWFNALEAASQSPMERKIAAYGKGRRLSKTLSRLAAAAFRPLQLGIGALNPSSDGSRPQETALTQPSDAPDGMQCWALPTATSTQQFALMAEHGAATNGTMANGAALATVQSIGVDEPESSDTTVAPRSESSSRANERPASASEAGGYDHEIAEGERNGKMSYPQLPPKQQRAAVAAAIDQPSALPQPDTTQLIVQRMQEWDGADESPPTTPCTAPQA